VTRRLAAVFAHPDDDAYGIAGSVALMAGQIELTVVLATSGEAGRIADPSLATPENLGRVREEEDRASWRAVGVTPARLEFLRYGDGALHEVPRGELVERVTAVLSQARPEVVVSFGPDGVTGHEDHVVIADAAEEAFRRARGAADGKDAFLRLLQVAIPQSRLDRFGELMREHGLEPPDPTEPFQPRGVPDDRIAVSVDVSGVYRRKLEAVRAHRTQDEMADLPEDLWAAILSEEHFALAWPGRIEGAPVLGGMFDGLGTP
jgi:LmbE family N-acetylglucosaminyl deacetylase